MKTIDQLQPKEVWTIFNELAKVPRPSKKEHKAVEFVYNFGKNLGLETIKDEVGNVIIRKPATKGMEKKAGLILEAHLDMVPQKNPDVKHNFETDPIKPRIVGDLVYATGTTLGADNGMGVSMALAVLQSKTIQHGPIECLFTVDEETGMTGARALKPGILKGEILMNLDSETEGILYVGCAGGLDGEAAFNYTTEKVPAGYVFKKVAVSGLIGGHSGMDIVLYRANANKILARIILPVMRDLNARLVCISGGSIRNSIPRDACAVVAVPKKNERKFALHVGKIRKEATLEYQYTDKDLKITTSAVKEKAPAIEKKTALSIVRAIASIPNGVWRMSDTVAGFVETSNNMAIIQQDAKTIKIHSLMRSSIDSEKWELAESMRAIVELAGGKCTFSGGYSGWQLDMNSPILKVSKEVYKKLFNKDPEVTGIHAGLECGILGATYPEWDMISFGPTIFSPHSPDERVNIESVGKCWKYLVELLKNAPASKRG